jgi:hypothetical protein
VGGRFTGKDIRGTVVPDGVTIIIHNRGLEYPGATPADFRYRLAPEFLAPQGKYAWLNRHTFVATLVYPVPESMRLVEVYQVR